MGDIHPPVVGNRSACKKGVGHKPFPNVVEFPDIVISIVWNFVPNSMYTSSFIFSNGSISVR